MDLLNERQKCAFGMQLNRFPHKKACGIVHDCNDYARSTWLEGGSGRQNKLLILIFK